MGDTIEKRRFHNEIKKNPTGELPAWAVVCIVVAAVVVTAVVVAAVVEVAKDIHHIAKKFVMSKYDYFLRKVALSTADSFTERYMDIVWYILQCLVFVKPLLCFQRNIY